MKSSIDLMKKMNYKQDFITFNIKALTLICYIRNYINK